MYFLGTNTTSEIPRALSFKERLCDLILPFSNDIMGCSSSNIWSLDKRPRDPGDATLSDLSTEIPSPNIRDGKVKTKTTITAETLNFDSQRWAYCQKHVELHQSLLHFVKSSLNSYRIPNRLFIFFI